jgi:broad specificity phosphatase PhoE
MPCPAPDTCWLYLIRHAATENNDAVPPLLQGRRTDPGLSAEGWKQAAKTGRFLASRRVAAVYSSPLLRARQTAEAIAEHHGLAVQIIEGLIEADVGLWEGRTWEEIEKTDPEAYRAFRADAAVHPYLGGENLQTVLDRAAPALERIMAENLGRTVVAVAHNVVNRAYLAHLLKIPLGRYRDVPQDNGGLNLIRYRNGCARLVTVNGVGHL